MNVTVNNGFREPVEGIAREAGIRISGPRAVVTVLRSELLALPRPGTELSFASARWTFERVTIRTNALVSFECTRIE